MCGGEEQDSTSGHVGKHPGNSVNHTMEARQERSTSPCGKMDMKKQRNGDPGVILSLKAQRRQGRPVKKTQQTKSNESEKWLEAAKDTSDWNKLEDVDSMRRDRTAPRLQQHQHRNNFHFISHFNNHLTTHDCCTVVQTHNAQVSQHVHDLEPDESPTSAPTGGLRCLEEKEKPNGLKGTDGARPPGHPEKLEWKMRGASDT